MVKAAGEEKEKKTFFDCELSTPLPIYKALSEKLNDTVVRPEAETAESRVLYPERDSQDVTDPAVFVFDEFMSGLLTLAVTAAEKMGGKVLESAKIPQEAFLVKKGLLIKTKQIQKLDLQLWQECLEQLKNVLIKANPLSEGTRPDYLNHLKTIAESLSALACLGLRNIRDDMKTTLLPIMELEMDRNTWIVENQVGEKSLVIENCNLKQCVYVYGCKDSVLHVKGKVTKITLDTCTKTAVAFTDVVAACEIVDCSNVEVQCQGIVQTIIINDTSGCNFYLGKNSLEPSITTTRSSQINIHILSSNPDEGLVEYSLPHQFVHSFKDGHFTTLPAHLYY